MARPFLWQADADYWCLVRRGRVAVRVANDCRFNRSNRLRPLRLSKSITAFIISCGGQVRNTGFLEIIWFFFVNSMFVGPRSEKYINKKWLLYNFHTHITQFLFSRPVHPDNYLYFLAITMIDLTNRNGCQNRNIIIDYKRHCNRSLIYLPCTSRSI